MYHWIREAGLNAEEQVIGGEITEIEFDEMWHFIQSKKLWLIKALESYRLGSRWS
jgi:hypothetical protein